MKGKPSARRYQGEIKAKGKKEGHHDGKIYVSVYVKSRPQ